MARVSAALFIRRGSRSWVRVPALLGWDLTGRSLMVGFGGRGRSRLLPRWDDKPFFIRLRETDGTTKDFKVVLHLFGELSNSGVGNFKAYKLQIVDDSDNAYPSSPQKGEDWGTGIQLLSEDIIARGKTVPDTRAAEWKKHEARLDAAAAEALRAKGWTVTSPE